MSEGECVRSCVFMCEHICERLCESVKVCVSVGRSICLVYVCECESVWKKVRVGVPGGVSKGDCEWV